MAFSEHPNFIKHFRLTIYNVLQLCTSARYMEFFFSTIKCTLDSLKTLNPVMQNLKKLHLLTYFDISKCEKSSALTEVDFFLQCLYYQVSLIRETLDH